MFRGVEDMANLLDQRGPGERIQGEAVGVRVLESMHIMVCGGQCLPFGQWPGQEKEWGFILTGLWEKSELRELPFLL